MLTARQAFRLAVVGVLALPGCQAPDGATSGGHARAREAYELLKGIDESNRAYEEKLRLHFVLYMSLDRMFPDPRVRELAAAAGRGRLARVDELLAAGVDPNARGTRGATPLFWAFRKQNLNGFVRLLEAGADPNPNMGISQTTVMHVAVGESDLRFLAAALAHGGDPDVREGNFDAPPAFDTTSATKPGDVRALEMLFAAGADLEAEDEDGYTLAMSASHRPDILYQLLIRGADYRKSYPNDDTLLGDVSTFCARARPEWHVHCRKVIDWLAGEGVELPSPEEL